MIGAEQAIWGGLGAGLAFYSNALRKLPLMRRPWEHVALFGVGLAVGGYASDFKESQRQGLRDDLARRERLMNDRKAAIAARNA